MMTLNTRKNRLESYEVYDEHGTPVGCVILPRQRTFFGPDRGTVYLKRQPPVGRTTTKPSPRAA